MTLLSLLRFEFSRWRARRWCNRHGHPGMRGEYPPLCTNCGTWVR